jgi:hypothetical protein
MQNIFSQTAAFKSRDGTAGDALAEMMTAMDDGGGDGGVIDLAELMLLPFLGDSSGDHSPRRVAASGDHSAGGGGGGGGGSGGESGSGDSENNQLEMQLLARPAKPSAHSEQQSGIGARHHDADVDVEEIARMLNAASGGSGATAQTVKEALLFSPKSGAATAAATSAAGEEDEGGEEEEEIDLSAFLGEGADQENEEIDLSEFISS